MSARVSQTSSNQFRVAIEHARLGQSVGVDPPEQVGDGEETDLRGLRVRSRGGARSFDLGFTVAENRSSLTAMPSTPVPTTFDTTLAYTNLETTAASSDFGITYQFDVNNDYLREHDAGQGDFVAVAYRGGRWQSVDVSRGSRDGNETVFSTSVAGPGLVAVGLRHPDIRVTDIRPQEQPVLSNHTSRLAMTLENRGSRDGTAQLRITANDRTLATPSVAVSAGSQRTVSVPVRFQEPGETDVEAGEYETQINVTQPTPQFSVTRLSVEPTQIQTGESVTVEATVANTGTAAGDGAVPFKAFGEVVTVKQVSLAPGQTQTVTVHQQFASPGRFQVGAGNRTTTVSVQPSADWQPSPTDESGASSAGNRSADGESSFQWALILVGVGIVGLFALVTVGRMLR